MIGNDHTTHDMIGKLFLNKEKYLLNNFNKYGLWLWMQHQFKGIRRTTLSTETAG